MRFFRICLVALEIAGLYVITGVFSVAASKPYLSIWWSLTFAGISLLSFSVLVAVVAINAKKLLDEPRKQ